MWGSLSTLVVYLIMSLFFRNLLFTLLQPGFVAILIPYWIVGPQVFANRTSSWNAVQFAATGIFCLGLGILLHCIFLFAVKGKGTLSPADPTKKLVAVGLYRFSRNPMYVGVTMMLIGEAIFFGSGMLWLYTSLIFLAFHVFILLVEEPRLRRDFGASYDHYFKQVPRWI